MNYITIKHLGGTRISQIKSLDNLKDLQILGIQNANSNPLFITFKGKDRTVDSIQLQVEVYDKLREEYLKSKKKNPETLGLISRIDSALGYSQNL